MKIDDILQLFVVKEKKFFPLFTSQGENIFRAANLLTQLIQCPGTEERKEIYRLIKEIETTNDKITAKIYKELNTSFVTPFDRDDIHLIASAADSFIDFINDSSKRIVMYAPVHTIGMEPIVETIAKQSEQINELLGMLEMVRKKPEALQARCKIIRALEGEADHQYEEYVVRLFQEEKDPIHIIKCKSIIQGLEEITDKGKDIAGVVYRTIIKLT